MPRRDAREELETVDAVFSALAHPSRRHVLLVLHYRGGSMTAGEVAARFACSWPTTSRHLKVLQEARLVSVEKRGRQRVYRFERERLREATRGWLAAFDDDAPPRIDIRAPTPRRDPS